MNDIKAKLAVAPVYCALCGYLKLYGVESKPAKAWPGRHATFSEAGQCNGVPPQTPRMMPDGEITRETPGIP